MAGKKLINDFEQMVGIMNRTRTVFGKRPMFTNYTTLRARASYIRRRPQYVSRPLICRPDPYDPFKGSYGIGGAGGGMRLKSCVKLL